MVGELEGMMFLNFFFLNTGKNKGACGYCGIGIFKPGPFFTKEIPLLLY